MHSGAEPEPTRSRSGEITATWQGRWLYSSVDPRREASRLAERAIAEQELEAGRHIVVVLEAGLGHLARAFAELGFRVESVAVEERLADLAVVRPRWSPSRGDLAASLDPELSERDFVRTRVVLGPIPQDYPAGNAAADKLRNWYEQRQKSLLTAAAFGRQWIRNAVKRSRSPARRASRVDGSGPLLLVFPGPSLEPLLRDTRTRDLLRDAAGRTLAVASALQPLAAAGIRPALVIATDGGCYAALHFRPLLAADHTARTGTLVLAPPSALLPPLLAPGAILDLRQGDILDHFAASGTPLVPPGGTVASSAIRAASTLGFGPLVLCGLDLGVRDGKEHARPHAFDSFRKIGSRTLPAEHRELKRLLDRDIPVGPGFRAGPDMSAYRSFLAAAFRRWNVELYRLGPLGLPGIEAAPDGLLRDLGTGGIHWILAPTDPEDATGSGAPVGLDGLAALLEAGRLEESEEDFLAAAADFPRWRNAAMSGNAAGIRELAREMLRTFIAESQSRSGAGEV